MLTFYAIRRFPLSIIVLSLRIKDAWGAKFLRCSTAVGFGCWRCCTDSCFVDNYPVFIPKFTIFPMQISIYKAFLPSEHCCLRHFPSFSSLELRGIIHAAGAGGSFQATSWSATAGRGLEVESNTGHIPREKDIKRGTRRTDSLVVSRYSFVIFGLKSWSGMTMLMMLLLLVMAVVLVPAMPYCFRALKAPSGRQTRFMFQDDQKIIWYGFSLWLSSPYY